MRKREKHKPRHDETQCICSILCLPLQSYSPLLSTLLCTTLGLPSSEYVSELPCLPASNWVQPMSYTRWRMGGSGRQSSDNYPPTSLSIGQRGPQHHLPRLTRLTLGPGNSSLTLPLGPRGGNDLPFLFPLTLFTPL